MFAKQILKPKYDEDKNSKRDLCPRSDGSCRLRSEPEYAERYRFFGDGIEEDNFIEKFQKTRIELNGNSRVASKSALFAGAIILQQKTIRMIYL